MLNRYLHHIDQDGLSSYRSGGGRLHFIASYPLSEEGVEAFTRWLSDIRRDSHTLLANLPDEGFQQENIPHVSGADRKALLTRKLTQQFYGSPYVTSLPLGRETEGRRDERVLFAGITRPAALDPWLEALQRREIAITALYTPPLLTRALLPALHPQAPRGLIVSFSKAGIRQVYFEGSRLRFSRLSPAPEGAFSTWGDACLRETQKTLQYLSAQRWITRNTRLPVWLLLSREDFAALLTSVERAEQFEFHLVNLDTLGQQFGLRESALSSDSQLLWMRLALRQNGGPQLAPDSARLVFHFWQARRLILWLGLLIGSALGVAALKNHLEMLDLQQQQLQFETEARSENQRYQQLIASLPPLPAPLDSLRSVVAAQSKLADMPLKPLNVLKPLSESLSLYPDIELQQFEWDLSSPDLSPENKPASLSLQLQAALPATAAGDPRSAIRRIVSFTEDIRSRGVEVNVLDLPFDAESDKTLRSDAETQRKRPAFKLRMIVREARP